MTRSNAPTLLPQPAGPPWWGSVMGTAILANLASLHGYPAPAWLILAIAWILLIAQSVGFARRVHHDRTVLTDALTIPGEATGWGMVSMGILAVGAATAQIIPDTWGIDAVLWTIGTILGIAITPWFCAKILTHRAGQPVFAWGLPVVAPMVSATGGANLSGHVPAAFELPTLVVATGCFALTLTCALPIFAYVYAHGWPPINASVSAFIPLGVVGQSTAAAHALSQHWERHGWHWTDAADHYGIIMACIGVCAVPWAYASLVRGLRNHMAFTPGWWASTFPIGTCCLGSWAQGWTGVSQVFLLLLAINWLWAGSGSVLACVRHHQHSHA